MKKYRTKIALAPMVLIIFGGLLNCGCALSVCVLPPPRSSLPVLEEAIRQADAQVEETRVSLRALRTAQEFEVKEVFSDYEANAQRMETLGGRLESHLEGLRLQGQAYFSEWTRQGGTYTNPQMHLMNDQQVTEMGKRFLEIVAQGAKARQAYHPFRFDVAQLEEVGPVNAATFEYLDNFIEKTDLDGERLQASLHTMLEEIAQTKGVLTQFGTPTDGTQRRMERRMEKP